MIAEEWQQVGQRAFPSLRRRQVPVAHRGSSKKAARRARRSES